MSNNDDWLNKLEKVIQYMANNSGKRPPKKEPEIGSWFSDQLGFYRKGKGASRAGMWFNEVREKAWAEFMEKNEDELLTKDEIWDKKLHLLEQFIQTYNRKPSETGDEEEVALLRWSYDQVKRAKPGTDRYDKWTAFTEKYSYLYASYDESWNKTFDELVAYVKNNGITPKQDGKCEEERRLSRWMTRQNMNAELAGERLEKWEWFKMELDELCETTKTKSIVIPNDSAEPKVHLPPGVQELLDKQSKPKCQAKDRHGKPCRNYPAYGKIYCQRAHLYLADYTPEQLANLQFCNGCNKWKDMPADKGQCVECSNRGYENRKKARAAVVLCKASGCPFKKSDENNYCGKHQIYVFVDECKAEGVRLCRRYLHGCREKLAKNYTLSSCVACLELERKQDNARRSNVDSNNIVCNETNEQLKQCTSCTAWKPLADYTNRNNSNVTLTCISCRDNNAIANANRDVEHRREQERIASQKPERKATKKAWEEANPEKVALKTLNYRDKQHSNNQEEYLRRNAENMKKWRENNPEKVKEANESNIKNIKYAYQSYIHKCQTHKTNFELTYEQFAEMVIMPCYYCNIIQDKGFNGIDRMDSMQGYILNNCVSCCIVCNRLKGAVDNDTFIKRVEHILTYNNIINGKLYPNAFANTINVSYSRYIDGAMQRDYAFELTEELFNEIIKNNCYICGKSNSSKHYNGIDRYDNNIGYTPDNVRCCCGQCNIMKKDLEYTYFINKLTNIHNNCKSKNITTCATPINNSLSRNVNKPSAEERKQNAKERKQRSRDAKRAQCGNAEYLKQRAEQMAKYRKNKKEKQNQTDKDNV